MGYNLSVLFDQIHILNIFSTLFLETMQKYSFFNSIYLVQNHITLRTHFMHIQISFYTKYVTTQEYLNYILNSYWQCDYSLQNTLVHFTVSGQNNKWSNPYVNTSTM